MTDNLARQWFEDSRLDGVDLSDSWLMGFRFEEARSVRLFCEFHLTKEHPNWDGFDPSESWACYKSGSILFRNCEDFSLATDSVFSRSTDCFDGDTMDTFEIRNTLVRVETGSLKFMLHTTQFEVVIDKAIS